MRPCGIDSQGPSRSVHSSCLFKPFRTCYSTEIFTGWFACFFMERRVHVDRNNRGECQIWMMCTSTREKWMMSFHWSYLTHTVWKVHELDCIYLGKDLLILWIFPWLVLKHGKCTISGAQITGYECCYLITISTSHITREILKGVRSE